MSEMEKLTFRSAYWEDHPARDEFKKFLRFMFGLDLTLWVQKGFWDGDLTLCGNSPCLPANNPWGVLIGAHDWSCGICASPVERVSWGQIKALYR